MFLGDRFATARQHRRIAGIGLLGFQRGAGAVAYRAPQQCRQLPQGRRRLVEALGQPVLPMLEELARVPAGVLVQVAQDFQRLRRLEVVRIRIPGLAAT